ncbi:MAG: translation elongation factor Ts [Candidatus Krumholzibacteriota bacterium]|nr:translation elongation factor Ts [Candidatus Krumholzibacteriota bacterium]
MEITPKLVKELRDRTNAGMMDCKRALEQNNGDMGAAIKSLREKGLSSAAKRAHREAREGSIFSYIHSGAKLGVLVELNCETDFVARTDEFQELGKNIAMQVAAASPLVVKREDLPAEILEREREIFRNQALQSGKPEKILEKIVEGKMEKFYHESCLLEQSYIKNDKETVEDLLKTTIGKLGENMIIKRFIRYQLGEESS